MGTKSKLEYIWLDGYKPTQSLRSKTKVLENFSGQLADCPMWAFDGSSTEQAPGGSSDLLLKPVAIFTDPARAWEGLRENSGWWFPLLLGLVLWVVLQRLAYYPVTVPNMQWGEAVASGRMEAAQEQQMSQFMSESPAAPWIVVGQQAIVWPILVLIQALVVWFGVGFVVGSKLRFGSAMDVVCWSGLVKLPQFRRHLLKHRIPIGRAGHPIDVARAFLYLATDASRYVTGAVLAVDGGWTAS